MTGTVVSAWTDRALDAERLNLPENRPEVEESSTGWRTTIASGALPARSRPI
jgi:hypothetical protein